MLDILRRVVQELNSASDLDAVLEIIVRYVEQSVAADVVSVYLTDFERGENVLMITHGLTPQSVGRVRLSASQGLVGRVARQAEPINLANAETHSEYHFVPGSGEEDFHAFLGIPVIHQRRVWGVLVVQRRRQQAFGEDTVSFLITLAAQLAGAIAHAEAKGTGPSVERIQRAPGTRFLTGVSGSPGAAIGTVVVPLRSIALRSVPDREVDDPKKEIERFRAAVAGVKDELQQLKHRMHARLPSEERAIFDAYALLIDSQSFFQAAVARIEKGKWAPAALRDVIQMHARVFEEMEDPYLRERAADVREIGRRVLMKLLQGSEPQRRYPPRTVLMGHEIGPTQLAEVPRRSLAAVVSGRGSATSHVAILARAMGVPAVMGVEDVDLAAFDGREIVVDGHQGRIYPDPSPMVKREYQSIVRERSRLTRQFETLKDKPAVTRDGKRIALQVNTGLLADIGPALRSGAEGIGLYRTEFPFMVRERFPGEAEQAEIYRKVLTAFAPQPVTFRTLDVGGDKLLPYFPVAEDNPFLGWRGIRITLDHPEIFLTQIRAMLRAAQGLDNLRILLPMVTDVGEIAEARALVERAVRELEAQGEAVGRPPVGAMIEVPSMIYQLEDLGRSLDFLSIGTNDLTQYLLAVDRNNARVAGLYDSAHPAVLRAIKQIVDGARAQRCPLSVCGEMAGDPGTVLLLMGLGISSLSMAAASLPAVKWVIRSVTRRRATALATRALKMHSAAQIRESVDKVLREVGLESLVRPRGEDVARRRPLNA